MQKIALLLFHYWLFIKYILKLINNGFISLSEGLKTIHRIDDNGR